MNVKNIVIEAKDISFAYDDKPVLENISFQVFEKEMVTIIGPNGGGKSTLLKLLLGLLTPDKGRLSVLGRSPKDACPGLGYVPQYAKFDERFPITAEETVLSGRVRRFFGYYSGKDRQIAREAMEKVGALNLSRKSFSALSGGQRQRLLIARALAGDPQILLLDEPTANIDALISERFIDLIAELKKECAILFVTHDTSHVLEYSDRVFCINKTLAEHPAGTINESFIKQSYPYPVKEVRHDITLSAKGDNRP